MKKIMHILNSSSYSGAEKVAITIIKNLPDRYESCYVSPNGPIAQQLKKNGILYYPLDKLSTSNLSAVIKDFRPDIIHAHDCRASVYSCLSSFGIPILSHLHNNDPRAKTWNSYSLLYTMAAWKFKKILLVSNSVLTEAIFSKKIQSKSQVIGNPIAIYPNLKEETKKRYDLAFMGRFVEQKDPIRFIELVKQLKQNFPTISAVMIGQGELFSLCKRKIIEFHLENTITLTGFVEEPENYLKQSKLLLMPSKWEGFGLAAIEALAYGLPVIAQKVGGLSTIITDDCGKLCNSNADFINEITNLFTDVNYYKNKNTQAMNRAYELNNLESYMETIRSIYDQL